MGWSSDGKYYCNGCHKFVNWDENISNFGQTHCQYCGCEIELISKDTITLHEAIEVIRRIPNLNRKIDKSKFEELIFGETMRGE